MPARRAVSTSIPTTITITIETGPYPALLARLLQTILHRSPHMVVTTPLPKFVDTRVDESIVIARCISALRSTTSRRRVPWALLPGIRGVGSFIVHSSVQILRLRPRVHVGVTCAWSQVGLKLRMRVHGATSDRAGHRMCAVVTR